MLQVGNLSLSNSAAIFNDSSSINMLPVVSAEWNYNLFISPYVTMSGFGIAQTLGTPTGSTLSTETGLYKKDSFTTKTFTLSSGSGQVSYPVNIDDSNYYKVIFYAKSNSRDSIMLNCYAGSNEDSTLRGSTHINIDSFGWTKIETYVGYAGSISSFNYTILAKSYSASIDLSANIYFTVPEVYSISQFEYKNSSLWTTESACSFFRPGESYIGSGNINASFPTNYRKIKSQILNSETLSGGYYGNKYMPITPVVNNPSFALAKVPVPFWKHVLPTDISPYKQFTSESGNNGEASYIMYYDQYLNVNKLVFKFNTILSIPTIEIYVNNSLLTIDGSSSTIVDSNGLLVLYWTGTLWTKTKWSSMPIINDAGQISKYTTVNKIKIVKINETIPSSFTSSYTDNIEYLMKDARRLQVIEASPRLEIDLTDFVTDININKSLDSGIANIPISSINTNDASITFTGIPVNSSGAPVPIFSNESNYNQTVLKGMLRKNVKFYIGFNLKNYSGTSLTPHNYNVQDSYIPGGVFYTDSWQESGIDNISVQAFDISRYLQTLPVPDYAANLKTVFDIITNILDMSGFTDYDYDSLYNVCNDPTNPMDLAYYFCNSKDTTILSALSEIFISHQIGAYIDEYGIMKFLNIKDMLSKDSDITLTDNNVLENGYSFSNNPTPGKISLKYQTPAIKQGKAVHNVSTDITNSASFIYTTSNDVVWGQQSIDSVGFNYLVEDMSKTSTSFTIEKPLTDRIDYFHTYDISANNYAIIEDEVISFAYKKCRIENNANSVDVYIKNDIELQAQINKFIKKYAVGLKTSSLADNVPQEKTSFDVTTTFTGEVVNVARGLFNTKVEDHKLLTTFGQNGKSLSQATVNIDPSSPDYYLITNDTTLSSVSANKITSTTPIKKRSLIYPTTERASVYQTYSTKFELKDLNSQSAGLFFNLSDTLDSENAYFLELTKYTPDTLDNGNRVSNIKNKVRYLLSLYQIVYNEDNSSLIENTIAWSDVTAIINYLMTNTTQVYVPNGDSYTSIKDKNINLRLAYFYNNAVDPLDPTKGLDYVGEQEGILASIFINNVEITGWQLPVGTTSTTVNITNATKYLGSITYTGTNTFSVGDNVSISGITPNGYNISGVVTQSSGVAFTVRPPFTGGYLDSWIDTVLDPYVSGGTATKLENSGFNDFIGWKPTEINAYTGFRQKINLPLDIGYDSIFGAFTSTTSVASAHRYIDYYEPTAGASGYVVPIAVNGIPSLIKEIYACEIPLLDRSATRYIQSKEFLNNILQGKRDNIKTYTMQSVPEVIGLNYYDVQYTTPAAVTADVYPIQYSWMYYPGNKPKDQKWWQTLNVPDTALSYSSILNTGYRSKMVIANNSPFLVYLKRDADQTNKFDIKLNLWTHEVITTSDEEIIEQTIANGNMGETVQIDSPWIQSKEAALNLISLIGKSTEGFAKNTTLNIFGNPLIQVGDALTLTYPLSGINQNKYLVHSISHSFSDGLKTTLSLRSIGKGLVADVYVPSFIMFDEQGGSSVSDMQYTDGVSLTLPSAPIRSGYTFNGWFTNSIGGTQVLSPYTPTGSSNITLYAQWTAVSSNPVATQTTYNTIGRTGMTLQTLAGGNTDDGYYAINLPYSITFNGQSYTTLYVGTNSYITFGGPSTSYSGLSAFNPPYDKIMVSSLDATVDDGDPYGGVWFTSNASSWRIRYQGKNLGLPANTTSIVWELSSQSTTPNVLNLQIGSVEVGFITTNISSSTGSIWSTLGGAGTGWNITS